MLRSTAPLSLALAALLALAAAPAHAQQGFALKLEGGYGDFTNSKDSFKAVFGSSGGVVFGAEVAYGFGDHLYVSLDGRFQKKSGGQRVFVQAPGSPVFKLANTDESARTVPVFANIGYRFSAGGSLVPYVGLGLGLASYDEESTVGGLKSTTSQTKAAGRALAGLEFGSGSIRFGVEAAYTSVPNSIGVAGVSKVYGEKDIGGFSVVGKIVITRGR